MIKADIVDRIAAQTGVSKLQAERAVEQLLLSLKRSMERGERIELRGFGVFEVKERRQGIGRNPRTGEEVVIPPTRTTRFKPGKNLANLPADL